MQIKKKYSFLYQCKYFRIFQIQFLPEVWTFPNFFFNLILLAGFLPPMVSDHHLSHLFFWESIQADQGSGFLLSHHLMLLLLAGPSAQLPPWRLVPPVLCWEFFNFWSLSLNNNEVFLQLTGLKQHPRETRLWLKPLLHLDICTGLLHLH